MQRENLWDKWSPWKAHPPNLPLGGCPDPARRLVAIDWLGTFQPYANGWIFHARLGWLYAPASTGEGNWLWSSTEGWLWTQNGIAPHFYNHESTNWLYLLPAGDHGMTFYDYTIEDVRQKVLAITNQKIFDPISVTLVSILGSVQTQTVPNLGLEGRG